MLPSLTELDVVFFKNLKYFDIFIWLSIKKIRP